MIFYPTAITVYSGASDIKHSDNDPSSNENLPKGTIWVNDNTGVLFVCTDDTKNNNVWTPISGDGGNIIKSDNYPSQSENLSLGTVWIHTPTGRVFVCTDDTQDNNVWKAIALVEDTAIKRDTDPTASENLPKGTIWVNDNTGVLFVCTDDTKDNNVWTPISGSADNNVVHSDNDPTVSENLPKGTVWINDTTGQMFVCVDDTQDNNVWKAIPLIVHNITDPSASENLPQGTVWINDTTGQIFVCKDDTQNNNVWQAIPLNIGAGGAKHSDNDPTVSENLPKGTVWINDTTGQIYVCVDDTQDNNVWEGYKPTIKIAPTTVDIVDIFSDGSGIALYQLDGNTNDTGGQFNGEEHSITYEDGKFGQCANFSSDRNGYIDLSSHNLEDLKAISLWFNYPTVTSSYWATILGSNLYGSGTQNNAKIAVYDGGLHTYHNSSNQSIAENVETGVWHHLVITQVGDELYTYYLDGNKVKEALQDNNASLNIRYIGSDNNENSAPDEAFEGKLDQIRFFNRSLNDDEVQQLYQEN